MSLTEVVEDAISFLPKLTASDVDVNECCPICLLDFRTILANAAAAPPDSDYMHGITKLEECSHIFCLNDLAEWMRSYHGSCPVCRFSFLDIHPPSENESSDGGEYVPDDEDEEEEETRFDESFGPLSDDFDAEEMEIDLEGYEDFEEGAGEDEMADDEMEDEGAYTDVDSAVFSSDPDFSSSVDEELDSVEAIEVGIPPTIREADTAEEAQGTSSDDPHQGEPK